MKQEHFNGQCRREQVVEDPMVFTRKIGHPELIFNEALYLKNEGLSLDTAEEKWLFCNSRKGDNCYVSQKHSYVQLFFTRDKAHLDFTSLDDPELI